MKQSITETIHESVKGLYDIGLVDAKTMRTFDAMCLPTVHELSPLEIKQLRLREKMSQSVFAEYLNASASTIKKWEAGEKHPAGPALKLLNLVESRGLAALA